MKRSHSKTPARPPKARPIRKSDDVQHSNDERIDQDFPGYPHAPADNPTVPNGSANAFHGTEEVSDEDDDGSSLRQK